MKNHSVLKKAKIKIGDQVQVIAGKDKGNVGKVLRIYKKQNRILVSGINLTMRHLKPHQQNQSGKRQKYESPIHYSNVLVYCNADKKGVRIKMKQEGPVKKRFSAASSHPID